MSKITLEKTVDTIVNSTGITSKGKKKYLKARIESLITKYHEYELDRYKQREKDNNEISSSIPESE